MQEKYFKNTSIKHKAQYKKLIVELDLQEIELKDLEQRKTFCELQYYSLREQYFSFMKKGIGSTLHPHPCCNPKVQSDLEQSFLKITPQVLFVHVDSPKQDHSLCL